uniref:Endonuclease/exonuclease/phosphatase domain-containing protein n=1 Tax=Octopus bimaculoides TaxID=37653 RepID=A0A0L8GPW3_OCTBM
MLSEFPPKLVRRPLTNPNETKDKFYEDLSCVITEVPRADKLIILGDFNARVGRGGVSWEGVIGKHGVGNCNNISLLLLQTCAEHGLLITNTIFNLPTRNRTLWMHRHSKHWHLIDYVIIRKRDRQDVRVTKTMKAPKRLNIGKQKDSNVKQLFTDTLEQRLDPIVLQGKDIEEAWTALRVTLYDTAMECLGPSTKKHKDWFDENCTEIKQLLEEKHRVYKAHLTDPQVSFKEGQTADCTEHHPNEVAPDPGFLA